MKGYTILFIWTIILFLGCNENVKRETDIVPEVEVSDNPISEETPVYTNYYIEDITSFVEKGTLASIFPQAKIESERMDNVKVVWLNRGQKNEVCIEFQPQDSTKVYRVTVEGRENVFSSKTGIKPGMTIDELNSINGKEVDFFGFGWDFGGAAKFNNGSLDNKNLFVFFKTDKKYGDKFIGDNVHTFKEAKDANLDLFVNRIIFEPTKSNHK